jgi:hypothetical protein
MDTFFPVEQEPTRYFSEVLIDTHGALDIAQHTYRNVTRIEPKLEDTFSEAEFCLCYGYVLTHRVLQVRSSIAPIDIPGFVDLNDFLRSLHELPAPMAHYLDGLGLYRDAQGQTLCPQIALPRFDINDASVGLRPSDIEHGYDGFTDFGLISAMYPHGILERTISLHINAALANGPNFFTQINPAIANPPQDVYLTTSPEASFNRTFLAPNARRQPRMAGFPLPNNLDGILNSIRWSSDLFTQFLGFLNRLKKHIAFAPYSRSTSGSPAYLCYCEPTQIVNDPDNFDYYAFGTLTRSEMHAARLFNYRVYREDPLHCSAPGAADAGTTVRTAPTQLHPEAPQSLTSIRGRKMYLTHFVNHFISGK